MTSEIRDRQSNVQIVEVGFKKMEDAIGCTAGNVKNIFVGNAMQQISRTIILDNSAIYGLAKINTCLPGFKTKIRDFCFP